VPGTAAHHARGCAASRSALRRAMKCGSPSCPVRALGASQSTAHRGLAAGTPSHATSLTATIAARRLSPPPAAPPGQAVHHRTVHVPPIRAKGADATTAPGRSPRLKPVAGNSATCHADSAFALIGSAGNCRPAASAAEQEAPVRTRRHTAPPHHPNANTIGIADQHPSHAAQSKSCDRRPPRGDASPPIYTAQAAHGYLPPPSLQLHRLARRWSSPSARLALIARHAAPPPRIASPSFPMA
jgi:hypothetical protein